MPIFNYKGRSNDGKLVAGTRTAQSADSLSLLLMREGITPITIISSEETKSLWQRLNDKFEEPVTRDEIGVFSRQMYSLCKTGIPVADALRNIAGNVRNKMMKKGLFALVENIEGGKDLASSMQSHPKIFTPLMISMVRVGQSSGHLAEAFLRINQYIEQEGSAVKNVKAALRYPIFVVIAMIAATVLINIFVIPAFTNVFTQAKISLPPVTLFFVSFSNFLIQHWVAILVSVTIISGSFLRYIHTPAGKYKLDKFILKIPFFGKTLRQIVLLRFSQAFAIIIQSGIPLIEGIELVSQSVNNEYARQQILNMRTAIEHGNNLTQAAAASNLFTPMEMQMLSVSEETGELGSMLEQMSAFYSREVDYDLKRLGDVIEPVLIILLSGLVLVLAFAVYLPIWNMAKVTKIG